VTGRPARSHTADSNLQAKQALTRKADERSTRGNRLTATAWRADESAMLLRLWGYDVKAIQDSSQALAVAECFAPDCVISDIAMPGLDGWRVTSRDDSSKVRNACNGRVTAVLAIRRDTFGLIFPIVDRDNNSVTDSVAESLPSRVTVRKIWNVWLRREQCLSCRNLLGSNCFRRLV
jgi:hypothetical protein